MKTDIHPTYAETHVTCSCGNTFTTRSTKPGDMHIELCNECHPFFTGKQKLVDSGGSRSDSRSDTGRPPSPRQAIRSKPTQRRTPPKPSESTASDAKPGATARHLTIERPN